MPNFKTIVINTVHASLISIQSCSGEIHSFLVLVGTFCASVDCQCTYAAWFSTKKHANVTVFPCSKMAISDAHLGSRWHQISWASEHCAGDVCILLLTTKQATNQYGEHRIKANMLAPRCTANRSSTDWWANNLIGLLSLAALPVTQLMDIRLSLCSIKMLPGSTSGTKALQSESCGRWHWQTAAV